jgi:rRNA processing protein Krr1/Pno1
LQSRLLNAENEKTFAQQRNDTLERKVESLNKFLDQERRLRLDLDTQNRSKISLDQETYDKLIFCKDKHEQCQTRE